MQEITLSLTIAEINQILDALGQLPYIRVYELIGKLQQQAQTQLANRENDDANHAEPAVRRLS